MKGDRIGSVLSTDTPTLAGSPSDGTYTNQTQNSTTGSGTGLKVDFTIASGAITDVRIVDPGSKVILQMIVVKFKTLPQPMI